MDVSLSGTLLKSAGPVIGIAAMLAATRFRKISWLDDLGFRAIPVTTFALWVLAGIALFGADAVIRVGRALSKKL